MSLNPKRKKRGAGGVFFSKLASTLSNLNRSWNIRRKAHYTHSPLPHGKWFRLVRLLPGNFDDPIAIELMTTEFNKAPPYEPISYCWGDANDRRQISCHGLPMSITASLFGALRRLRRTAEPRLLWADGICIDQDSVEERGHQVAFMGEVYSRGQRTLVWLGEISPEDDAVGAFATIKEYNEYVESQLEAMDRTAHEDIWESIFHIPPFPRDHGLVSDAGRWESVKKLLDRPWWTRAWVLQEIGLSRSVLVFWGQEFINFSDIVLLSSVWWDAAVVEKNILRLVDATSINSLFQCMWTTYSANSWLDDGKTLQNLRDFYLKRSDKDNIVDILNVGRGFETSEEVDHIIAFLGHPFGKGIQADYSRPVEETTRTVAEQICILSHSLRLLCFVQDEDKEEEEEGEEENTKPSWVPTWHQENRYSYLAPRFDFDASLCTETTDEVVISISGRQLRVAALLVDTIKHCTSPFDDDGFGTERNRIEESWAIYSESLSCAENRQEQSKALETFFWTMVRGVYPREEWIAPDFLSYCRARCSLEFYHFVIKQDCFTSAEYSNSGSAARFQREYGPVCDNRRFFTTQTGLCGLGFSSTQVGNVVVVIFGCPLPLVLRPTGNPSHYRLVGQCYVNGLMSGEAIDGWGNGLLRKEEIVLI